MEHLLRAVEGAIAQQNFYAALATALALPDICGWAEDPNATSKSRYVAWFETFLQPAFTHKVGRAQTPKVFLSGTDCYALRCAFLHEGRDDITEQKAQEVIEHFQFTIAPPGWVVHRNMLGNKLQLQVDIFCREIVTAVRTWLAAVANRPEVQQRLATSLRLHDVNGNVVA